MFLKNRLSIIITLIIFVGCLFVFSDIAMAEEIDSVEQGTDETAIVESEAVDSEIVESGPLDVKVANPEILEIEETIDISLPTEDEETIVESGDNDDYTPPEETNTEIENADSGLEGDTLSAEADGITSNGRTIEVVEDEPQGIVLNASTSKYTDVTRLWGETRYQTAMTIADEIKSEYGGGKFKNIVIATGEDFPDALAGAYLAHTYSAPILLVNDKWAEEVAKYTRNNIVKGGKVYLLGGEIAISADAEKAFSGLNVERLGGSTRYDTNIMVLKEAGAEKSSELLVSTGKNYPDALSASAVPLPMFIVGDSLSKAQHTYLKYLASVKNRTFYILGGTIAVNKNTEDEVAQYGRTERIAGDTKYDTSIEIAKEFFPSKVNTVVLATATNFPDGNVGGPLAILKKAPIIVTNDDKAAKAYNYVASSGAKKAFVLGGEGVLSSKVVGNTAPEGVLTIGKTSYYVKANGQMAISETIEYNGASYKVDSAGVIQNNITNPAWGIDVSAWNGKIDWNKVKKAGVDFAIIRVGGRFAGSGNIYSDTRARENLAGAIAAGIKVGVYFFSQAINEQEAIQEAKYTLNAVKGFNVELPVVIDTEYFDGTSRHDRISATTRTKVVKAFMDYVESQGYKSMLYAGMFWLRDNLIESELTKYDKWIPQYYKECQYWGDYVAWQYSSTGRVNGIDGDVDMNYWYGVL